MNEIKVYKDEGIVELDIIEEYEKKLACVFPTTYKELLSKHNAISPEKSTFKYYDNCAEEDQENDVYFYAFENDNLDYDYCDEFVGEDVDEEEFPKGLIAFAGTPNGNYICFDYTADNNNPKVVLLHPDALDEEDNLLSSFLANSFDEFINSLY